MEGDRQVQLAQAEIYIPHANPNWIFDRRLCQVPITEGTACIALPAD